MNPEQLYNLFFNNIKKFLYPENWVELDLSFSKSELLTLLLVEKEQQVIMSQIAEYVNLPMSTTTGIVERLVQNGYLIRDRSESDRRIVVVTLTEQGLNVVSELKGLVYNLISEITKVLSDEEQEFLLSIIMKIAGVLKDINRSADEPKIKNQVKKIVID